MVFSDQLHFSKKINEQECKIVMETERQVERVR